MMEGIHNTANRQEPSRAPEARYSYYRRCQLFRQNSEQCKAPAEKDATICHAHAAQKALAFRRNLERRIVLAEAVAEMRRQGNVECELADLFNDFKGIQVTLAVTAKALIQGRIDCKTAGRLLVHLQTMSKLLWTLYKSKTLPLIDADSANCKESPEALGANAANLAANEREKARISLISPQFSAEKAELRTQAGRYWIPSATITRVDEDTGAPMSLEEQGYRDRGYAHGPPKLRAA